MRNRATKKRQPAKPRKGASPAEIKAWIAECQARATPQERAEYEGTGETLKAICNRIGFDPASGTFAPRDRTFQVEVAPDDR